MANGTTYDRAALAAKVGWEGGVLEALEYGIKSGQITDPGLARLWAEAEALYVALAPKVEALERELGQ